MFMVKYLKGIDKYLVNALSRIFIDQLKDMATTILKVTTKMLRRNWIDKLPRHYLQKTAKLQRRSEKSSRLAYNKYIIHKLNKYVYLIMKKKWLLEIKSKQKIKNQPSQNAKFFKNMGYKILKSLKVARLNPVTVI